jgi:hypothetical protein
MAEIPPGSGDLLPMVLLIHAHTTLLFNRFITYARLNKSDKIRTNRGRFLEM